MFFEERQQFFDLLVADIVQLEREALCKRLKPCIRLNMTSDIQWENESFTSRGMLYKNIFEIFSTIQFYDYTKIPGRQPLQNYHLTFSLAEDNLLAAREELSAGKNISVVFASKNDFPKTFINVPVIDGDVHDLRFKDPKGVVVGVKAKGDNGKKDATGFVKRGLGGSLQSYEKSEYRLAKV